MLPPLGRGREVPAQQLVELGAVVERGPGVIVVTGREGVGKTDLVVACAHAIGANYEKVLFAKLSDGDAARDVRSILRGFITELGRDPGEPHRLMAQYAFLSERARLLVVLDRAIESAHTAKLLPAGRECLTLITSRTVQSGLGIRVARTRLRRYSVIGRQPQPWGR
jgi:thymidylate kinase